MGEEAEVAVRVLFFAKARELSGTEVGDLRVSAETTYDNLLTEIVKKFSLEQIRNSILLAINEEYRGPESPVHLKNGDEIAVIPPISGGKLIWVNGAFIQAMDHIKLVDSKLSVDEVCGLVSKSTCGAVSLFVGMTKENFEDKKVIHLEYEAYEPMAVKAIKKICEDIRSKWKVENIAVYHRMGVVPVLEASVVIAVSSVHRSESLQAVQHAIDSLKASVPIWKKEVYETSPPVWKENQESLPGYLLKEHSYDVPESTYFSYTMEETSVPPHLIQVKATTDEINHRIEMFIKRKRETINLTNIRDFCQGVTEGTCARVNALLVPRKGSKSHLKVRKVLNKWGPQTRGLDPGSGDQLDSQSKGDQKSDSNSGSAVVSYPGIEGRIAYAEKYLNISNKPVPKDIYARLKEIEDKILYLQSVSPEYSLWGQPLVGQQEKDLIKLRRKKHTSIELTSKIKELEGRLTVNDVQ